MSQPVYVWDSRTGKICKVDPPPPDKSVEDMSLGEYLAHVDWKGS